MRIYKFILSLFFCCNLYSQQDKDSLNIILPREIHKLDSLIAIEPIADNYFYRGHYKFKIKDYKNALIDFNKCIALIPNNADYYYNRGILKERMSDYNGAINDFNSCLSIDENYLKSYLNRAYSKSKSNDLNGAINDYTFYLKFNPKNSNAYFNRGMIKSNQNLNSEAILDFDCALKVEPNNSEILQSRAVSKAVLGRKDALSDFNKVIQLNPSKPESYINRAIYYLNYNIKGDFCSDLKKAVSLGSKQAEAILKDNCK